MAKAVVFSTLDMMCDCVVANHCDRHRFGVIFKVSHGN